jgi:hypothetical protein
MYELNALQLIAESCCVPSFTIRNCFKKCRFHFIQQTHSSKACNNEIEDDLGVAEVYNLLHLLQDVSLQRCLI